MNYLKAISLDNKPFVQWDLYATSHEELVALGLDTDPLIMPENEVPQYQFGVCPLKIVGGALEERSEAEMDAFEAEYNIEQIQAGYASKINALATETFAYGGFTFPMHETARLYYECMRYAPGSNYKVLDVDGEQQTVLTLNVAAFIDAYYVKLTDLLEP